MWSKAICWIDDCRIPFVNESIDFNSTQKGKVYGRNSYNQSITERTTTHYNTDGRFPANILVCDDMLNDGIISKSIKGNNRKVKIVGLFGGGTTNDNNEYNDKGTNSRYYDIDKWFDKIIE